MLDSLKSFDAYPKTLDDFRERWVVGAIISIVSTALICFIVIGEFSMLGHIERKHHMLVDTDVTGELEIHLNITFDKIPCPILNIDALDGFGESMAHIERSIMKTRLSETGQQINTQIEVIDKDGHDKEHSEDAALVKKTSETGYCGSCYGAEDNKEQCCNSCLDVKLAYDKKQWAFTLFDSIEQCARQRLEKKVSSTSHEGCRVQGDIKVTKVQGAIHIAPGRSLLRQRLFTLEELFGHKKEPTFDVSHTVNKFGFGQEFPGLVCGIRIRFSTSNSFFAIFSFNFIAQHRSTLWTNACTPGVTTGCTSTTSTLCPPSLSR